MDLLPSPVPTKHHWLPKLVHASGAQTLLSLSASLPIIGEYTLVAVASAPKDDANGLCYFGGVVAAAASAGP